MALAQLTLALRGAGPRLRRDREAAITMIDVAAGVDDLLVVVHAVLGVGRDRPPPSRRVRPRDLGARTPDLARVQHDPG